MLPRSTSISRSTHLARVDLPHPDSPAMPSVSPRRSESDTSSSAWTSVGGMNGQRLGSKWCRVIRSSARISSDSGGIAARAGRASMATGAPRVEQGATTGQLAAVSCCATQHATCAP